MSLTRKRHVLITGKVTRAKTLSHAEHLELNIVSVHHQIMIFHLSDDIFCHMVLSYPNEAYSIATHPVHVVFYM